MKHTSGIYLQLAERISSCESCDAPDAPDAPWTSIFDHCRFASTDAEQAAFASEDHHGEPGTHGGSLVGEHMAASPVSCKFRWRDR